MRDYQASNDIKGIPFGRLTPLHRVKDAISVESKTMRIRQPGGGVFWMCQCECGEQVPVRTDRMLSGKTQSCGCLRRELASLAMLGEETKRQALLDRVQKCKAEIFARRGTYKKFPFMANRSGADREHDLEPGTYARMLEQQEGVCAICKEPPAAGRRLELDHCHTTERVRGLLCNGCNTGIGFFREDIMRMARAMQYLTAPPSNVFRGASKRL